MAEAPGSQECEGRRKTSALFTFIACVSCELSDSHSTAQLFNNHCVNPQIFVVVIRTETLYCHNSWHLLLSHPQSCLCACMLGHRNYKRLPTKSRHDTARRCVRTSWSKSSVRRRLFIFYVASVIIIQILCFAC